MESVETATCENGLCMGCGFCASACERSALGMEWSKAQGQWLPEIDAAQCDQCGKCLEACPQSPKHIVDHTRRALGTGESFGLDEGDTCLFAYTRDDAGRLKSPSGGILTELLQYLLERGDIDGVLAAVGLDAPIGESHFEIRLLQSAEQIDASRGSAYSPLSYHVALSQVAELSGRYALIGVPCIIRAMELAPKKLTRKIRYTFAIACGRNASSHLIDSLAMREGIAPGQSFRVNLRDKQGIPDPASYNIVFELPGRTIRKPLSAHWR